MTIATACAQCIYQWNWVAIYDDDTALCECDGSGQHHAYADIELGRLKSLGWAPTTPNATSFSVQLSSDATATPVVFRRHAIELQMGQVAQMHPVVHVIGWESTRPGQNSYAFLFDDGTILLSDNRNAV